jgi:hypothetical protein
MKFLKISFLVLLTSGFFSTAGAAFLFFPVPKTTKPAPLQKVIDELDKASEVKAVAYVFEDKAVGTKKWVWAHVSGAMPQEEANSTVLSACRDELEKLKQVTVNGQAKYVFGAKQCELHPFEEAPRVGSVKQ